MTGTMTLAGRLSALDDDDLRRLIASRELSRAKVADFFDLAEALLDAHALQRVFGGLDRPTLATLAAVSDHTESDTQTVVDRLTAWGAKGVSADAVERHIQALDAAMLIEVDGGGYSAYQAVKERLAAWPSQGLPSAEQLASGGPPAALSAVPTVDRRFVDRLASERAFAATNAIAELGYEFEREPGRELQKGGLALPDARRIASALSLEPAQVPVAVWCARAAGLIALEGTAWLPMDGTEAWNSRSTAERWGTLATAWLERVPDDIRILMVERAQTSWGDALRVYATWLYPASDTALVRRIDEFDAAAEFLGITAKQAPSTAGVTLLEDGAAKASAIMAESFPSEVDQVYVQHDLSIVSPGPLTPRVDARLRTIADVESTGLAATFRVSPSSLLRAIAGGETAESIRALIEAVSLTGIPQPLAYLIDEAAARYGRVRVSPGADGTGSLVTSDDQQIIGTIVVDQTLSALGLRQHDAGRLGSRFGVDTVYWALVDAHYPVVAENAAGAIVALRRRHAHTAPPDRTDTAAIVVQKLRANAQEDTGGPDAWLSRQLDIAVRSRTPIVVTVAMPDGREIEYSLEPTGVGGGRLRGRDRAADIERTLPLSSIRSVRPR